MKTVDRAKLRGKPLDPMCYKAKTSRHEFGRNDNRVFCYGLVDAMTDEVLPQCRECKALVDFAKPMED